MITEDQVMRVLENADPVRGRLPRPVPDAADYLDTLRHRGNTVTLIDAPRKERRPASQWRAIVAAAAAVVAIVIGAIAFAVRDHTDHDQVPLMPPTTAPQAPTPAPTPPLDTTAAPDAAAAVETARGLVDAVATFDADRALTYMSDEAVVDEWGSVREFRLWLSFMEATSSRTFNIDCQPRDTAASAIVVRCRFENHHFRSDEIGLGPYTGGYWDIAAHEGAIMSASVGVDLDGPDPFSEQLWEPFRGWVQREHLDDFEVMYDGTGWRISEESIPIWEQRLREYASSGAAFEARGFIGLPVPGWTPSTPETGELVDEFYILRSGYHYSGAARLYADGRLIWRMYFPINGWSSSTGWMEQRLTPEGIDLLRSHIQVGHGPGGEAREIAGFGLSEWLRPSAWEDQWFKGYVPSHYAVCLTVIDLGDTGLGRAEAESTVDEMLGMLPATAADLLAGRQSVPHTDSDTGSCLRVSTDEARQLDVVLAEAGVSQDEQRNSYMLEYYVDIPDQPGLRLEIVFEPVFPDGTISCSACG